MWALNPRAYHELSHLGRSVGLLFLLLALALALTGHELAQATTMGLAVGGGHHRNSGSGQPRDHFLRAYCSGRRRFHHWWRSALVYHSSRRAEHVCSQTEKTERTGASGNLQRRRGCRNRPCTASGKHLACSHTGKRVSSSPAIHFL